MFTMCSKEASEPKKCVVSSAAADRGFGTVGEICTPPAESSLCKPPA